MRRILKRQFFERPTLIVVQDLLGKFLIRKIGSKKMAFMITEVEAYDGFKDKASHASRGITSRNIPMFGRAGVFYVYFTYGIHWMLNIVTGKENYPAAVLIRGVCDLKNNKHLHGPAILTKYLKINVKFNKKDASKVNGLWLEDGGFMRRGNKIYPPKVSSRKYWLIKKSPRIGIDRTGPIWAKKPYRFYIDCREIVEK